jgi:hypothetical protein
MFLGLSIIASVVLIPPYIKMEEKRWEQGLIELYAKRQQSKVQDYEYFSLALSSDDPVLLERLAYRHLRLKPKDGTFIAVAPSADFDYHPDTVTTVSDSRENTSGTADWALDTVLNNDHYELALIEQWLHQPNPQVGVDYPQWRPFEGSIVRLSTGPMRFPLLIVAGIFIMLSFMVPGPAVTKDKTKNKWEWDTTGTPEEHGISSENDFDDTDEIEDDDEDQPLHSVEYALETENNSEIEDEYEEESEKAEDSEAVDLEDEDDDVWEGTDDTVDADIEIEWEMMSDNQEQEVSTASDFESELESDAQVDNFDDSKTDTDTEHDADSNTDEDTSLFS